MTIMKGAEIVVDHLVRSGMPYAFGICGHGNVGLLDALYDRAGEITLISPRHEQAAGHMADAYFRVRHQPVATITSCGPGSANMPMSLACAQADSSAFLAITANVPTSQFNRAPFQESYFHHQAGFTDVLRPYVKRSFQPTRVEMLPLAMRQAQFRLGPGAIARGCALPTRRCCVGAGRGGCVVCDAGEWRERRRRRRRGC